MPYRDYMQEYLDTNQWDTIREDITACGLFPVIRNFNSNIQGIEVGVKEGMNSIAFLEMCPNIEKLYGIDPYIPYIDLGYHWSEKEQEEICSLMLKNINIRNCQSRFEHIRKKSLDAVNDLPDNHFHFVFIDAEHTREMVLNELTAYWPKIIKGGIISGHDYDKIGSAVHEWKHINNIDAELINLRHSSWYFIKN